MSGYGLIVLGVAALAALTMFACLRRYPERELSRGDVARVKWFLVAMVVWTLVLRGLATEASHRCAVDSQWLSLRSGLSGFWSCSPQLLSGGPVEIFVFLWAWAPFPLMAAFCVHHLLRTARRPHRDSKES
jgi:hypothetical protein